MTAGILGGTPKQSRTIHRRIRSTEPFVGFGEVDKAHDEQRGVLLRRQFLLASHHEDHVDRRGLRSKATLLTLAATTSFVMRPGPVCGTTGRNGSLETPLSFLPSFPMSTVESSHGRGAANIF